MVPYPGHSWNCQQAPARQPHEYHPNGTVKLLTLFHPATGTVRVSGVTRATNDILLGWLRDQLSQILHTLPAPCPQPAYMTQLTWQIWQAGLSQPIGLSRPCPPLRLILVMDNLAGHKNGAWVAGCFKQGILPLYTPLGGSWLNRAESIQRILKRRALEGQHFLSPAPMIQALEAVARHWNRSPTPFIWGGKRHDRRHRAACRHPVGGSGAVTARSVRAFYARLRPR
jgi:hypothetical protein